MATPPSYNPAVKPKKSTSVTTSSDTIFWNDANKCVEGNMGEINLISTKSDLYLPIQYVNSFVTVYNDNSTSSINVFFPNGETTYGTFIEVPKGNVRYIQFLFGQYPNSPFGPEEIVPPPP
jgi:hypothetical protein